MSELQDVWFRGFCGNLYEQVIEETILEYLHQTAQPGELLRDRQLKKNDFIAGLQSGVSLLSPEEQHKLPPVTA